MSKRIITALPVIILLLQTTFLHANSDKTGLLKTEHFLIQFNVNETAYAREIGNIAENLYDNIQQILEFTHEHKIILIIDNKSTIWNIKSVITSDKPIFINSKKNIFVIKNELHYHLFKYFLRDIKSLNKTSFQYEETDETILNALAYYSYSSSNKNNDLILKDYFLNVKRADINLSDNIENTDLAISVYSGLFLFLNQKYGKHIIPRVIKEIGYYGNFLNSLSAITGLERKMIYKEFTEFLLNRYKNTNTMGENTDKLILYQSASLVKDFAVSPDNNIAVLQKINDYFIITIIDNTNIKHEIKLGVDYNYSRILYQNDKTLIVCGNTAGGSIISTYSSADLNLIKSITLPFININEISCNSIDNSILINVSYGNNSGFLILGADGKILKNLIYNDIMPDSVVIFTNDYIYYTSGNSKNYIKRINQLTGEIDIIFTANEKITSISLVENNILISFADNNYNSIIQYETESGKSKNLYTSNEPVIKTFISRNIISMLMYNKGNYLINSLNINDIK